MKEALAQPEQRSANEHLEPIGMVAKDGRTILFYELDSQKIEPFTEIYTTPPQRKPMTDEQIDKAWRSVDYTVPWEQHRIDIARAIEAAHGIKE